MNGSLGVRLGLAPPESLLDLCRELASRVAVIDAGEAGTAAELRRGVMARTPFGARSARRWVLWADTPADLDHDVHRRARLVLTPDGATHDEAGRRGLPVRRAPASVADLDHAVPVAPFVRSRVRRARGLPDVALARHKAPSWRWGPHDVPVPDDLADTALAAASAVVVDDDATLLRALAWGAPVVAPAAAAAAVDAVHDRHVLVADSPVEAEAAARQLAEDQRTAARLGWAGRGLVEERHSLVAAADAVLLSLRLAGRAAPSALERRWEEMDSRRATSAWARVNDLVGTVTRPFSPAPGEEARR